MAFRCSSNWIRKTEEKRNATRSTVIAFVEDLDRYKIKLIEKTNEGIRRKYYWRNKNSSKLFRANRFIKNKNILRCLDVIAREYCGKVVDENLNIYIYLLIVDLQ